MVFDDYKDAFSAGVILQEKIIEAMPERAKLSPAAVAGTLKLIGEQAKSRQPGPFVRKFNPQGILTPPHYFVRVTAITYG